MGRECLSKHGLTTYSNEVAKVRVLVRLMALAEIYREFCDRAWEEEYDCELTVWASELDLNHFRLAQCVSSTYKESTAEDQDELYSAALRSLAEEARREIHEVLIQEFGSESYLFVSLWNTVEFQRPEDTDEEGERDQPEGRTAKNVIGRDAAGEAVINWLEDAETILSDVTPHKMRAYEWITGGMHRVR